MENSLLDVKKIRILEGVKSRGQEEVESRCLEDR